MRALWGRIKLDFFENDEVGIERFENAFKSASWSWTPDLREVDSKNVDRRKDMLLGPLFSSTNSPWPIDDKGPMIPLAQFDLGNASKILGEDLGCGLIQIFCPQGDSRGQNIFIREVEAEIVRSDLMIAPPLFSDDVNGFASVGWAQGSSSKDRRIYGGKCLQIEGYEKKQFNLWLPCAISDEYIIDTCDEELKSIITDFDEIYKKNEDKWSCGGFHLFGSFYPIQYYHADRDRVFFTFESEFGFRFGDGQAQVFFYIHKEYGPIFSFDWSCF